MVFVVCNAALLLVLQQFLCLVECCYSGAAHVMVSASTCVTEAGGRIDIATGPFFTAILQTCKHGGVYASYFQCSVCGFG